MRDLTLSRAIARSNPGQTYPAQAEDERMVNVGFVDGMDWGGGGEAGIPSSSWSRQEKGIPPFRMLGSSGLFRVTSQEGWKNEALEAQGRSAKFRSGPLEASGHPCLSLSGAMPPASR